MIKENFYVGLYYHNQTFFDFHVGYNFTGGHTCVYTYITICRWLSSTCVKIIISVDLNTLCPKT